MDLRTNMIVISEW